MSLDPSPKLEKKSLVIYNLTVIYFRHFSRWFLDGDRYNQFLPTHFCFFHLFFVNTIIILQQLYLHCCSILVWSNHIQLSQRCFYFCNLLFHSIISFLIYDLYTCKLYMVQDLIKFSTSNLLSKWAKVRCNRVIIFKKK